MKITDFKAFATLSDEDRKAQFAKMDDAALTASLTEAKEKATAIFALDAPTVDDAADAEALVASINHIESEDAARKAEIEAASQRFAAAKAQFAGLDGEETDEGDESEEDEDGDESEEDEDTDESEDTDDEGDEDGDESEEGEESVEAAAKKKKNPFEKDDEEDAVTTAAANRGRAPLKTTAASKVGRKTKRPVRAAASPVTITAAADVPNFSNGQALTGMAEVAKAVQSRVKGFAPFNARAAEAMRQQSGGAPVLHKFGAADFAVDFDSSLVPGKGVESEHATVKEAVKAHSERITAGLAASQRGDLKTLAAAMAWCAPSEVVYNWIADYVVDGLLTLPEVSAPRGGLMVTEGPQLAQGTYDDSAIGLDGEEVFGFGGTEAEMEAGYVKTCETIECPEFVDHRLDFDGYCFKIPILTEKSFPELVADALRLADVLYAHKMNRRYIGDIVAASTEINALNAFGAVQVDTLEALTQVAIKERRWWNIGENATMEVKLPQEAREIFKFDMARRSGLALNDIATDQKVAAHFAAYNLSVEYISDFDQRYGSATPQPDWPESIRAIMYPVGTFVRAVEPVINLSAVYDAASLSANEYTGVFFEQGVMTFKRGYRSHVLNIPVCVAGRTGANDLTCSGFEIPAFDGSL